MFSTPAWEQRKLGEVVGVNSGRDYKHLESGDFPVYGTGGYMLSVSEALSYTEDAIGIGRKGTIDKPFILKAPFWTVDTLFYCIPKGENDLEFVFSLFQNITWKKLDESTGVPSLSKQLIDNVRVTIPSEKEQAQLGYIFESINTLISLHQRKLDNVKMLKKSLLQKLFPKDGEKIPELRFPGFTDDWEQRKLGEISKRVTRKNSNLESTLPLTISAQYGLVDQITFFNKQIASKDMSGYYLIKKGEFAYNKSYSKDAPWGAVKRLDNYDKGVLSSLYIVFKLSSNIDSDFVAKYFETSNWHSEVSKRATEGARDHGLLNISASDFLSIEILIPNKTMEQKEIAQFLKLVDSTLSLHQRKLDHLKELKKGLLQQMFV